MNFHKFKILFLLILIFSGLTAQWSTDPALNTPVAVLEGEQAIPKVGTGQDGDVFIGFFSNEAGNYNVRLQRFDAEGNGLRDPDK